MKSTTNTTSHIYQTKMRNVLNTVSIQMARKTFIKQGKWDEENKTHTFSWWFWEEMKYQWGLKMGARSVWEGDSWERRWIVTKVRGKTEKDLKTAPIFAKQRVFRDWRESPQSRQFKPPKHSRTKIWKIFLSVFLDCKVYSWVSRELSRENLYVPLASKSPKLTRELAAEACDLDDPRLSRQNRATLFFEIFQFL